MRDLYRRIAEAYLQNKKAKDEPLPGIRGRLNYRGIATEMKIPYRQFLPGSELRLLVDASLDELRVSNDSLHEQPRRVIKPKVSTFSITYGDLKANGRVWLRDQGYYDKSIPSYLSLLNVYMRYLGRKDKDSTAQDFGTDFESRLYAF